MPASVIISRIFADSQNFYSENLLFQDLRLFLLRKFGAIRYVQDLLISPCEPYIAHNNNNESIYTYAYLKKSLTMVQLCYIII